MIHMLTLSIILSMNVDAMMHVHEEIGVIKPVIVLISTMLEKLPYLMTDGLLRLFCQGFHWFTICNIIQLYKPSPKGVTVKAPEIHIFLLFLQVEKLIKELPSAPSDSSNVEAVSGDKGYSGNVATPPNMDDGTDIRETQSILLERIASEMNRLKFYISHAQVCDTNSPINTGPFAPLTHIPSLFLFRC